MTDMILAKRCSPWNDAEVSPDSALLAITMPGRKKRGSCCPQEAQGSLS